MTEGELPLVALAQAVTATGDLVAAVPMGGWSAATPCADWTVRDLVNHLVEGNLRVAGMLAGDPPLTPEQLRQRRAVDHLGDDPAAAYRRAADALLTAFRRPGALAGPVEMPVGTVPGPAAVHLRITEMLVHGWDLARATGQRLAVPVQLAAVELEFTRANLARVPPGRSPFDPPQPIADDAPALDRLAALLGRRVGSLTAPGPAATASPAPPPGPPAPPAS